MSEKCNCVDCKVNRNCVVVQQWSSARVNDSSAAPLLQRLLSVYFSLNSYWLLQVVLQKKSNKCVVVKSSPVQCNLQSYFSAHISAQSTAHLYNVVSSRFYTVCHAAISAVSMSNCSSNDSSSAGSTTKESNKRTLITLRWSWHLWDGRGHGSISHWSCR